MTNHSDLRSRLLAVVEDKTHQAITFTNLDDVPIGSTGYLSPGGRTVLRDERGWLHDGLRFEFERDNCVFTSQSGPANDARLTEMLEADLVPRHHILVGFEAVTDREAGDWEGSEPAYSYTTLANPKVISQALDEGELARLYFEVEAASLGESDAYSNLEKQIARLGEDAAMAVRDKAAVNRHEWLQFDK